MSQPIALPRTSLSHAYRAVEEALWVDSIEAYEGMLETLSHQPSIGIDTEFVRERTFFPRPGLIQISDGIHVWLVDVVQLKDHQHLASLITSKNSQKILHSVGEDLEILSLLTANYPKPLFDTQMAAALLGFPLQMRYEHLVEVIFGDTLPGGQARSNWCQRPLSPALLAYAAQDVIYLPSMAGILADALDRKGRLAWLEEDCQRVVDTKDIPTEPLLKVKGAGRLNKNAMAYAASLARWREQQARQRDLPKSFVLKDDLLLELATRADETSPARALESLKHLISRWLEGLTVALQTTDVGAFQVPEELIPLTSEQRQCLKDYQAKVAKLAEEMNVDPGVLASKRQLTRLIRGEMPDWLSGWRGPLLKDTLDLALK